VQLVVVLIFLFTVVLLFLILLVFPIAAIILVEMIHCSERRAVESAWQTAFLSGRSFNPVFVHLHRVGVGQQLEPIRFAWN